MTRIQPLSETERTGKAGELLGMVQKKLGRVPNMMATLAQSPAALEGYLQFSGALAGGKLSTAEREQIALLVGEVNKCRYCVAAHSALGKRAGLNDAEVSAAKTGKATSARSTAILTLTKRILETQANLSDEDVTMARNAGLNDAEVLEVVANVSLNIYTNYINHVADPVVDF